MSHCDTNMRYNDKSQWSLNWNILVSFEEYYILLPVNTHSILKYKVSKEYIIGKQKTHVDSPLKSREILCLLYLSLVVQWLGWQ
jgi:hypothetical protein